MIFNNRKELLTNMKKQITMQSLSWNKFTDWR